MNNEKTFAELGLSDELLHAVEKKGFKTPSAIQAGVIPLLLHGERDIIGQAQTGTGKTAAFALPLLQRLNMNINATQAIILAPTRELAIQVGREIQSFRGENSPSVAVIYGGNSMRKEMDLLRNNPMIVVGTPGRVQHHIRNKKLKLNKVTYFVLDEADEMLNFGFRDEIEGILNETRPGRRMLLFSATMPRAIVDIVDRYMGDYDTVKVAAKAMTNKDITQKYYCLRERDKFDALCRIMEDAENFYAIVFCRTKANTDYVASQLAAKHLRAEAIHGDIDQKLREKILGRFRDRKINILVATDVAARGIDVPELNFVVNYTLPESFEIYTHRIGRTGRAGQQGTAITFINGSETRRLRFFERNLKVTLEKGTLPDPANLVQKKKTQLVNRLEHLVNNEDMTDVIPLATQLLEEGKALEVVCALLKDAYGKEFDLNSYRTIQEDTPRRGGSGGGRGRGRGGRSFGGRSGGGYRRRGSFNRDRRSGDRGGRREGGGKRRGDNRHRRENRGGYRKKKQDV